MNMRKYINNTKIIYNPRIILQVFCFSTMKIQREVARYTSHSQCPLPFYTLFFLVVCCPFYPLLLHLLFQCNFLDVKFLYCQSFFRFFLMPVSLPY